MDRYTLTSKSQELQDRFIIEPPEGYQPNYNVSPTHLMPVITIEGRNGFSYFYWGMHPKMSGKRAVSPKLYNAISNDIKSTASYYNALKTNRCIVPADGYYSWKKVSKKGMAPYRIIRRDKKIFSFPGIWEEFEDPEGELIHTFTIITTPSPSSLLHFSDTAPVILDESSERTWLDPKSEEETLFKILRPVDVTDLHIYSVSPKVNDVKQNGADLIQLSPAADQFGNYSLFD